MKRVVISQPMFFPWIGMLEQMNLADVFVYYDDVQFSKGSFTNRVQIKTAQGSKWLTVPVGVKLGDRINEVKLNEREDWRNKHRSFLAQTYADAKFVGEMLEVVNRVYERSFHNIAELAVASMEAMRDYFSISRETLFVKSSDLRIGGGSSGRVLEIVRRFAGDVYITGHGARNYLDHELFAEHGVAVEYMNYKRNSYPQINGAFDPHVSALDLIANAGRSGAEYINSSTEHWRDYISRN